MYSAGLLTYSYRKWYAYKRAGLAVLPMYRSSPPNAVTPEAANIEIKPQRRFI